MVFIFLVVTFLFLSPNFVYAYLDPGTGSYIFQIIIGLLLGGLYFVRSFLKSFFSSIVGLFKKGSPKKRVDEK